MVQYFTLHHLVVVELFWCNIVHLTFTVDTSFLVSWLNTVPIRKVSLYDFISMYHNIKHLPGFKTLLTIVIRRYLPNTGKTVVAGSERVRFALRNGGELSVKQRVLFKQLTPLPHGGLR